ncbi:hypothetical protein N9769_01205 [Ascidiaceihabitans sp.]|nr:hypothetical protein [Ascidiaceihabitans sp.]
MLNIGIVSAGIGGLYFYEIRNGTSEGIEVANGLTLTDTLKNDIIDGGLREDVLGRLDGASILRVFNGANWLYGGEITDTLNAGSDDYFILGGNTEDDLHDVVDAGDWDDRVDGSYGNYQIYGGAGNDTINIGLWGK